ncbi:LVIVD repeat-containing protein [Methanolobus halotolerans]|uniref:LVIVD repeat-containing protein n=1 Tax=Methanolobus halotolerans TaxID=2052935 RepID=UPI0014366C89|nr:hypothetical protein [Methanolobus halotolerans]
MSADGVDVIFESGFGHLDDIDIRHEARDVEVKGDYIYAINGEGYFQIIDISNLKSPELVGDYDTGGKAGNFEVLDDYAYLVYSEVFGNASLNSIDISDPSSPTHAGSYDINLPADDAGVRGIELSDGYLYLITYNGLVILDVNNLQSPVLVGRYDTLPAPDVAVEGDHAYIVHGTDSFWIVNISDPSSPDHVGTYDTIDHAGSIDVSDGYAYVTTDDDSLKVIDVNNPSSPTIVGSCNNVGSMPGVVVKGGYAYLNCLNLLSIIDISNPSSPTVVGSSATETFSFHIATEDNIVCQTDEYHGFIIYRIEKSTTNSNEVKNRHSTEPIFDYY